MNWDQQLIKACTETDGTPHPHTDHVLSGAKWQRDQLRTSEAVTRLANFLHNDDVGETLNEHEKSCQITGREERTLYKNYARAAITALLGDTP